METNKCLGPTISVLDHPSIRIFKRTKQCILILLTGIIIGPYFNYCMSWDWISNTSAEDIEKLHNRAACVAALY